MGCEIFYNTSYLILATIRVRQPICYCLGFFKDLPKLRTYSLYIIGKCSIFYCLFNTGVPFRFLLSFSFCTRLHLSTYVSFSVSISSSIHLYIYLYLYLCLLYLSIHVYASIYLCINNLSVYLPIILPLLKFLTSKSIGPFYFCTYLFM